MITRPTIEKLENAIKKVHRELNSEGRTRSWNRFSEEELFEELASCIIGSRITFEKATAISKALRQNRLLQLDSLLRKPGYVEYRIYSVLSREKCLYARNKARYIGNTGLRIYADEQTTLKKILRTAGDEYLAREVLSDMCMGIGLKQASLFLRNIYYADNLAILDTHVINYLQIIFSENRLAKALNKNLYLEYESRLLDYSKKFKSSVARMDIAIWIVMRVVSREFKWML